MCMNIVYELIKKIILKKITTLHIFSGGDINVPGTYKFVSRLRIWDLVKKLFSILQVN